MTNSVTALAVLKRNYLFKDLPDAALERIAALAVKRHYARGEIVFSQGDQGDALYGIASGRVRISATGAGGKEVFLSIMEPGDTFGEIAVMDGLPRTAGATALDNTRLLVIRRQDLLELLAQEPQLAIQLIRLLCMRLRWTSELVEESAFLGGPARLAKRLLILASLHGRPSHPDQLELSISQAELAHFLGISRQMVNQHLRDWQKSGWVALGRARVTIRNKDALRAFIAQSELHDDPEGPA
jgi:CRP-like cAMP-binding protein